MKAFKHHVKSKDASRGFLLLQPLYTFSIRLDWLHVKRLSGFLKNSKQKKHLEAQVARAYLDHNCYLWSVHVMQTALHHSHESQMALMAVHDMHELSLLIPAGNTQILNRRECTMWDDLTVRTTECIVM